MCQDFQKAYFDHVVKVSMSVKLVQGNIAFKFQTAKLNVVLCAPDDLEKEGHQSTVNVTGQTY